MNEKREFRPYGTGKGHLHSKLLGSLETGFQVNRFGQITLPLYGPCYIEGNHLPVSEEEKPGTIPPTATMALDVKRASDHKVVATIELPVAGQGDVAMGKVTAKDSGKVWRIEATIRKSSFHKGKFLGLRLPEVAVVRY